MTSNRITKSFKKNLTLSCEGGVPAIVIWSIDFMFVLQYTFKYDKFWINYEQSVVTKVTLTKIYRAGFVWYTSSPKQSYTKLNIPSRLWWIFLHNIPKWRSQNWICIESSQFVHMSLMIAIIDRFNVKTDIGRIISCS